MNIGKIGGMGLVVMVASALPAHAGSEENLPADTLAVVKVDSVPALGRRLTEHPMAAALREVRYVERLRPMFENWKGQRRAPWVSGLMRLAEADWTEVFAGEWVLAVVPVGDAGKPQVVVYAPVRASDAEVSAWLGRVLGTGDATGAESTAAGQVFRPEGEAGWQWGIRSGRLVLAHGEEAMKAALAWAESPPRERLVDTAEFRASAVATEPGDVWAYVSARVLTLPPADAPANPATAAQAAARMKAMGLDAWHSVTWRLRLDPQATYTEWAVRWGERRGLFAAIPAGAAQAPDLRQIPADARDTLLVCTELKPVAAGLVAVLRQTRPELMGPLLDLVERPVREGGWGAREGLTGNLGSELLLSTDGEEGVGPSSVPPCWGYFCSVPGKSQVTLTPAVVGLSSCLVAVDDETKLRNFYENLAMKLAPSPTGGQRLFTRRQLGAVEVLTRVNPAPEALGFQWAVTRGRLYFSLSQDGRELDRMLAVADRPRSGRAPAGLTEGLALLPESRWAVGYVDLGWRMSGWAAGWADAYNRAVDAAGQGDPKLVTAPAVRFEDFPFVSVCAVNSDEHSLAVRTVYIKKPEVK